MRLVFYKPEQIPAVWFHAAPLFQKVVDKAVHGEFDVADLYRLAREGKVVVCLVWDGDEVVMATAVEFVYYPKVTAANVLAMGGYNMKQVFDICLPAVRQFCRDVGAKWIQCEVSAGAERLYRPYGYRTVYRKMRMEL